MPATAHEQRVARIRAEEDALSVADGRATELRQVQAKMRTALAAIQAQLATVDAELGALDERTCALRQNVAQLRSQHRREL